MREKGLRGEETIKEVWKCGLRWIGTISDSQVKDKLQEIHTVIDRAVLRFARSETRNVLTVNSTGNAVQRAAPSETRNIVDFIPQGKRELGSVAAGREARVSVAGVLCTLVPSADEGEELTSGIWVNE